MLYPKTRPAQSFGARRTPFDPVKGRFAALSLKEITEVTVRSESDDCLICEDNHGEQVVVAKPWMVRRSPFDGKTINGFTYTYTSANTRDSDDGSEVQVQEITPSYFDGMVIMVVPYRTDVQISEGRRINVDWVELSGGQSWATL